MKVRRGHCPTLEQVKNKSLTTPSLGLSFYYVNEFPGLDIATMGGSGGQNSNHPQAPLQGNLRGMSRVGLEPQGAPLVHGHAARVGKRATGWSVASVWTIGKRVNSVGGECVQIGHGKKTSVE